jgi:hypothetical protein
MTGVMGKQLCGVFLFFLCPYHLQQVITDIMDKQLYSLFLFLCPYLLLQVINDSMDK